MKVAKTTPSYFVGTMPDIAQDEILYKAENYSFFFQYVGLIVLESELPKEYYEHYILMQDIIALLLQFSITYQEIDRLQVMVNKWVANYK
ncbi:hypothetical protein FRC11_002282, partial [Ceratobasidium sp. 423]